MISFSDTHAHPHDIIPPSSSSTLDETRLASIAIRAPYEVIRQILEESLDLLRKVGDNGVFPGGWNSEQRAMLCRAALVSHSFCVPAQDLLDHSLTLNTRSAPLWLISVPLRRSSALARVICLDYSFVNEGEPLEEEKIFESVLSACEPTVVALSLDVPGPEHICGERFDHPTLANVKRLSLSAWYDDPRSSRTTRPTLSLTHLRLNVNSAVAFNWKAPSNISLSHLLYLDLTTASSLILLLDSTVVPFALSTNPKSPHSRTLALTSPLYESGMVPEAFGTLTTFFPRLVIRGASIKHILRVLDLYKTPIESFETDVTHWMQLYEWVQGHSSLGKLRRLVLKGADETLRMRKDGAALLKKCEERGVKVILEKVGNEE